MARSKDDALEKKRKTEILEAAARCFVAKGFHQASMRAICAEAGLSAGAVYNYFSSKDAIIEGMIAWEFEEIQELAAYLSSESNALTAVVESVRSIVKETTVNDAQLYTELVAEAGRNETLRAKFDETDAALQTCLLGAIKRGQNSGQITKRQSADALLSIVTAIYEGFIGRIGYELAGAEAPKPDLAAYATMNVLKP